MTVLSDITPASPYLRRAMRRCAMPIRMSVRMEFGRPYTAMSHAGGYEAPVTNDTVEATVAYLRLCAEIEGQG